MKDFIMLNGFIFNKSTDFYSCRNKIFGWNNSMFKLIYDRFEKPFRKDENIIYLKELDWKKFKSVIACFFPKNREIKNRYSINIFFLDFLNTYRGLRHSKGLPVRGQRTWTNARSVFKSNLNLRNFKVELSRRIYGNLPTATLNTLYLAEQTNYIWNLQWKKEWRQAKIKRLKVMYKDYNNYFKIDLNAMSKGFVDGFKKKNTSKKKNKEKKNTFTLGFEPNFIKYYLDPSKSNKEKAKFHLVFTEEVTRNRINVKKKPLKKPLKKVIKKKNPNWD